MKLSFNVFGFEVGSIKFEDGRCGSSTGASISDGRAQHRTADLAADVVEVVERGGAKLLNRGIKKMSGFWVDWMMR